MQLIGLNISKICINAARRTKPERNRDIERQETLGYNLQFVEGSYIGAKPT